MSNYTSHVIVVATVGLVQWNSPEFYTPYYRVGNGTFIFFEEIISINANIENLTLTITTNLGTLNANTLTSTPNITIRFLSSNTIELSDSFAYLTENYAMLWEEVLSGNELSTSFY